MLQCAFVFILDFNQSHASNRIIIFKCDTKFMQTVKNLVYKNENPYPFHTSVLRL